MINSFRARFIQRVWIASLAAVFMGLAAKSVYACTPITPTPWFKENVNLLKTDLPDRIMIKQDGQTVTLTNNLDTSSFYINGYNELEELGKSVEFSSYNNALSANGYYVAPLEPRNILQDNRPADIKPPEPQNTIVKLLLVQKSYSVQFRISYEISNNYIPNSVYLSENQCKGYSLLDFGFNYPGPLFVIAILILIVLTVTFIVLLKKYKSMGK